MRKKLFYLIGLFLATFALNANATIQITVKKTTMSPLYLYAWNDGGNVRGEWPGTLMKEESDGTYTATMDVSSVNIIFTDNAGHQSKNIEGLKEDACFNVNADGTYTRLDCTTGDEYVEPTPTPTPTGDVYVIAGNSKALLGEEWNGSAEANKMTVKDGVATLVKENVTLAASTYLFKVVKNGGTWIPDGTGNDSQLVIAEDGIYTVTFTYKIGEAAATAAAAKTGSAVVEVVYTIVGDPLLLGSNWDLNDAANEMKEVNGLLTLIKKDVSLKAGEYKYKVVGDHSWAIQHPQVGDSLLKISADGKYDVTFTYDKKVALNATAVKTGDLETPKVTYTVTVPEGTPAVYIAGAFNNWSFTAMTKVTDTEYTVTIETNTPNGYKYACGANWAYEEVTAEGTAVADRNWSEKDVVAKWKAVPSEAKDVVYTVTVPAGTPAVYIVGNFSNWNEFKAMNKVSDTEYTLTIKTDTPDGYKYACGDSWDYEEVTAEGIAVDNRNWSEKDVVAKWKAVPGGQQVEDVYVVAGDAAILGAEWDKTSEANKMTVKDGVATLVKENLILAAQTYEYKVVKNGETWIPEGNDNSQLVIEAAGIYTITFSYKIGEAAATANIVKTGDVQTPKVTYTVTVPEGTPAVYIVGEFNEWKEFVAMTKVSDTEYTITIETLTPNGYKYTCGAGWAYEELTAEGTAVENRTYAEKDVVAKWKAVPSEAKDVVYTVTVPEGTPAVYIAGNLNGWTFTAMTKVTDTEYTLTVKTDTPNGYKYACGANWAFEEVTAEGAPVADRNWAEKDVVAKWKDIPMEIQEVVYTVTVPEGTPAVYIAGNLNNWTFTAMNKVSDTEYTLTVKTNTPNGYKYACGDSWDYEEVTAEGTAVADRNWSEKDVVAKWKAVPGQQVEVVYTIVGDPLLLGSNWDLNDAANEMKEVNGLLTLVKENVSLNPGSYKYKVVGNHSWDIQHPGTDIDSLLVIAEVGIYTITFTYDKQVALNATAVKTGNAQVKYYVTGNGEEGNPWMAGKTWTGSDVELVDGTVTFKDVPAGTYAFKVTKGSWEWTAGYDQLDTECTTADVIRGTGNDDNNVIFTTYKTQDITITYANEKICLQADTKAEVVVEYVTVRFAVVGWEKVYAYAWDETSTLSAQWPGDEITSTLNEGFYSYNLKKGANIIFNSGNGEGAVQTINLEGINADVCYVIGGVNDEGKYNATIDENCGKGELVDEDLYIIGDVKGTDYEWAANKGEKMTQIAPKVYTLTTTFGKGDGDAYFAFATTLGTDANDWATLNANRFGPKEDNTLVTLQSEIELVKIGENAFKIASGDYTIAVDLNTMRMIVSQIGVGVDNISATAQVRIDGNIVTATFDGKQTMRIFSTTGQLINTVVGNGSASAELTAGMYIIMVGNEPFKAFVR